MLPLLNELRAYMMANVHEKSLNSLNTTVENGSCNFWSCNF